MKPASRNPRSQGRQPARRDAPGGQAGDRTTPDTDMQPEDSGNAGPGGGGSGPAAQSVMKQTSKTGNKSGNRR